MSVVLVEHEAVPTTILLALASAATTGTSQEIMQTASALDEIPVIAFGEPAPTTLPPNWTAPGLPRLDRLDRAAAALLGGKVRRAPRRAIRLAVELFHGGRVESAHLRDLSSEGVRLIGPTQLTAGEPLPGRPGGFGLRFRRLGLRDRSEILSFVAAETDR